MNRKFEGKRLLVLGGSQWAETIFNFAKENGIHLIGVGNNPNSKMFDICDESYMLDSTDEALMLQFLHDKAIDGVYVGASEPVVRAATNYLPKAGLPCYCTSDQWNSLQNKTEFKSICLKHGLPVLQTYSIDDVREMRIPHKSFPLMVKPSDGCASKGSSVSKDYRELLEDIERAAFASSNGNVLIEPFVNNESVVAFYTICNGNLRFMGLNDKYPVCIPHSSTFIGGLFVYQSALIDEFRSLFETKISCMLQSLNIQQGNLWFEVFHSNGKYYFNEAGYRYGGSLSMYPVDYYFGVNQVAMDIHYALSGTGDISVGSPILPKAIKRRKFYGVYPIILSPGIISTIDIANELELRDSIVKIAIKVGIGDTVESDPSFARAGILVHFLFDNITECKSLISTIHNSIKIEDIAGENMILRLIDLDKKALRS